MTYLLYNDISVYNNLAEKYPDKIKALVELLDSI